MAKTPKLYALKISAFRKPEDCFAYWEYDEQRFKTLSDAVNAAENRLDIDSERILEIAIIKLDENSADTPYPHSAFEVERFVRSDVLGRYGRYIKVYLL